MKYKKQLLCGEIVVLLRGSEGMLAAADRYCDASPALDLDDYIDWIAQHGLQARFCRVPGIKGILHRWKLQRITNSVNQALQIRDAYITRESSVDPDRLQALEREINEFLTKRKEEDTP